MRDVGITLVEAGRNQYSITHQQLREGAVLRVRDAAYRVSSYGDESPAFVVLALVRTSISRQWAQEEAYWWGSRCADLFKATRHARSPAGREPHRPARRGRGDHRAFRLGEEHVPPGSAAGSGRFIGVVVSVEDISLRVESPAKSRPEPSRADLPPRGDIVFSRASTSFRTARCSRT